MILVVFRGLRIELGIPVLLVAELIDNSTPESFFAPPQPTTLRLTMGVGTAERLGGL